MPLTETLSLKALYVNPLAAMLSLGMQELIVVTVPFVTTSAITTLTILTILC